MTKIQVAIAVVVVAVVAGVVWVSVRDQLADRTVSTVVSMPVHATVQQLSFTYPSGEAGYTLIEPPLPPQTADGLEKVYIIMETAAYISYQAAEDPGVTPPTVSIFVVAAPEEAPPAAAATTTDRMSRLEQWAAAHEQYTSYSLRTTTPEETKIDGVKFLRYQAVGQYEQSVYLALYDDRIYTFIGQRESAETPIAGMFDALMQTVTFE